MYNKKVSIPGINTSNIKTLSYEELVLLFKRYQIGDLFAKYLLLEGNF